MPVSGTDIPQPELSNLGSFESQPFLAKREVQHTIWHITAKIHESTRFLGNLARVLVFES